MASESKMTQFEKVLAGIAGTPRREVRDQLDKAKKRRAQTAAKRPRKKKP
jgi:hypothetical protein